VSHAGDADELFEVLGDELGAVVGDNARRDGRVGFTGALDDGFHVFFLHFLADFPMDDQTAAAIEDGAEKVKGAGDVEVTDIDMPVLVGLQGLDETGSLLGDGRRGAGQQSCVLEDAVHAGRATSHLVGIQHHEGQAPVAFQRVTAGEGADAILLITGQPVVAWHPGVVLVDFAEAFFPVVELAGADADPGQKAPNRDLGLVAPGTDKIDDLVPRVVGRPGAVQASPRVFFSSA